MKVAASEEELMEAINLAKAEGRSNFGNEEVYMEKYLGQPRHIEVQILADSYGNVIHLGERDCSIQRRHQKVWEEAPSPALSPQLRFDLGEMVRQAVAKFGYRGAGTIEFLYENGKFYFMEMNTRLQVEHPISEMITGIDLVREQILVAMGNPLSIKQEDIIFRGHAIECRVNAEHPETFVPSPGKVGDYHAPGGPGIRIDSALYSGYRIPPHYDSLVSKLVAYGNTREECLQRLRRALSEYVISGIETTLPLHRRLASHPDVIAGEYDVHWLEKMLQNTSS